MNREIKENCYKTPKVTCSELEENNLNTDL